jgi:hypothetical protein
MVLKNFISIMKVPENPLNNLPMFFTGISHVPTDETHCIWRDIRPPPKIYTSSSTSSTDHGHHGHKMSNKEATIIKLLARSFSHIVSAKHSLRTHLVVSKVVDCLDQQTWLQELHLTNMPRREDHFHISIVHYEHVH